MFADYYASPLGLIEITADNHGLLSLYFVAAEKSRKPSPLLEQTQEQLSQYFNRKRSEFDLPLSLKGTPFQKSVWQQLLNIPLGATCSYQQLADALNKPGAARAVGAANGKNPLSIIVPCHRVIGANGQLTGYLGGLERKQWLLEHESSPFRQRR